ncbi:MAG: hypothetical protein JXR88_08410 [Clostridia bacterium]|nr:hypothetical protein [Clostridia bacterium]
MEIWNWYKSMKDDVYRYLKMQPGVDEDIDKKIEILLTKTDPGRTTYKVFDLIQDPLGIKDFEPFESESLKPILKYADRIILFAATLGVEFDRKVKQLQYHNQLEMMLLDAVGSAKVEALVDEMCEKIKTTLGGYQTPRFSPGYGDFDLAFQEKLLRLIDGHKIGLTVTNSFLLSPSKSITGVIGFSLKPMDVKYNICDDCLRRTTCDKTICRRVK